ncbi:MAG: beta-ketoacyl-ACP synthase II [Bacteroidales bacterium]|nr:beta-ketoacyl-ACP synthase II [Bacteroidales bacterium]
MELKRVVVTGIGAITPLGKTPEEFWKNLSAGVSGAGFITRFDASNFKTKFACEVKDFDPAEYMDRKEARKLDLYAQFALASTEMAMKDSGINLEESDMTEFGVIWGSGIGGSTTLMQEVVEYVKADFQPRFSPYLIPKMIADIAAGHISMRYGLKGPNFSTVSACASSSNAIIDAYNYIRLGIASGFVAGGSEAAINEVGIGGFNAMKAISTRNDDPTTASRPFDVDRDGFVMGEGSATLILEEYERAKARGAKIYAEIIGAGMSADAHHLTAPHPDGEGAARVMRNALKDAGISPEKIDYINVHGTSTPLGDISEALAIKSVFGEHAFKLNISSTKSMHGHLLGGAGAIEALACILTIQHNLVPPTINFQNPDPEIDYNLNFTFHKAQARKVDYALSNTFGFGGHNASLIFKRFDE